MVDKKHLANILRSLGIITDSTTGQVVIHLNQGGISKVVISQEVK